MRFSRTRRPRGSVTVELILSLPILVILVFTGIQFGILVIVTNTVSHAANIAARETAKGATDAQVQTEINTILGVHNIALGTDAGALIEKSSGNSSLGSLTCQSPGTTLDSDEVRVTVCVDMSTAPLINVLNGMGLNLSSQKIEMSGVATNE
ncbi:MAG: pilus assembly protein [Pirellulaceae bacterium]|jgi:Flp pilus assembly protein TadG|nr:pilus assembly protein [Pirellulaceae bacterium]